MESGLAKVFSKNEKLSKQQEVFRNNIESIDLLKAKFNDLEVKIQDYKAEYLKVIAPLNNEYFQLIKSRILVLSQFLESYTFSKSMQRAILEVLENECKQYESYSDDPEIKAIYNEYFIDELDEEDEFGYTLELEENDEKSVAEEIFSFEDPINLEEWKANSKNKMKEKAKEDLRTVLRQRSIKSIFKDLIKAFHPDKELDEGKKIELNERAKEITEAYRKNDLFTLLQFELLFQNANADRITKLKDEKLKIYNELLQEQKTDLELKLSRLKEQNEVIYRGMCSKNSNKDKFLKKVKKEMKGCNENLKTQIDYLRGNKEFLKRFIEVYLIELDTHRD